MDDLIAFLLMRLEEDRDAVIVADALSRSPWTSTPHTVRCGDGFEVALIQDGEAATAAHIARWNPARVLVEVEAKRQRLDWLIGELRDDADNETVQWLLRLESTPHADHPDYRPEWQPAE